MNDTTGLLWWGKPAKAMPREEYEKISADSAPPGVYTPNMSDADSQRWRATLLGQRTGPLRVEIRRTLHGPEEPLGITSRNSRRATYAQVLIILYEDGEVRMSANGQLAFPAISTWLELNAVVMEALDAINAYRMKERQ